MSRRRRLQSREAELNRREFLRAAGCAALTTTSIISTIWDLRMVNAATLDRLAFSRAAGYKAMVCIFMFGGNDSNNFVVPVETTNIPGKTFTRYSLYQAARGTLLSLPAPSTPPGTPDNQLVAGELIALGTANTPGLAYALHPNCVELRNLYDSGKLAVVTNVGTLAYPITKTQYGNGSGPLVPKQLFSHADQQVQWQTSVPDQGSRTGWGGRCADLLNSNNDPASKVSMSVSVTGANTWEVGNVVNQFNVSTGGAVSLTNIDAARKQALRDILVMGHPNLYEDAFSLVSNRAIQGADDINTAIGRNTPPSWTVPFPNTGLGNQLKMVARLIASHADPLLGQNRQIFFTSVGGYDLHSAQVGANPSVGNHANLLNELSECMWAFQQAMIQLGLEDDVVSFTMSDFSRTLKNNGEGTDHAWGSHHLVMGGTNVVNGGRLYGTFPDLTIDGVDDVGGTGRWIATTAVDQFSATIARWFGVQEMDMATVFPNIGRFATSDLGFMNLGGGGAGSIIRVPDQRAPSLP